jgi:hypothetical protein
MSNLARMIDQDLFAVYCTRTRKQLYVLASTVLAVESDLTPTGMAVAEIQPSPLMQTHATRRQEECMNE